MKVYCLMAKHSDLYGIVSDWEIVDVYPSARVAGTAMKDLFDLYPDLSSFKVVEKRVLSR